MTGELYTIAEQNEDVDIGQVSEQAIRRDDLVGDLESITDDANDAIDDAGVDAKPLIAVSKQIKQLKKTITSRGSFLRKAVNYLSGKSAEKVISERNQRCMGILNELDQSIGTMREDFYHQQDILDNLKEEYVKVRSATKKVDMAKKACESTVDRLAKYLTTFPTLDDQTIDGLFDTYAKGVKEDKVLNDQQKQDRLKFSIRAYRTDKRHDHERFNKALSQLISKEQLISGLIEKRKNELDTYDASIKSKELEAENIREYIVNTNVAPQMDSTSLTLADRVIDTADSDLREMDRDFKDYASLVKLQKKSKDKRNHRDPLSPVTADYGGNTGFIDSVNARYDALERKREERINRMDEDVGLN